MACGPREEVVDELGPFELPQPVASTASASAALIAAVRPSALDLR